MSFSQPMSFEQKEFHPFVKTLGKKHLFQRNELQISLPFSDFRWHDGLTDVFWGKLPVMIRGGATIGGTKTTDFWV